jgi:hypothetical protein
LAVAVVAAMMPALLASTNTTRRILVIMSGFLSVRVHQSRVGCVPRSPHTQSGAWGWLCTLVETPLGCDWLTSVRPRRRAGCGPHSEAIAVDRDAQWIFISYRREDTKHLAGADRRHVVDVQSGVHGPSSDRAR